MEFNSITAQIREIARRAPDKAAVEYRNESLSYAQLEQRSDSLAAFLAGRLGDNRNVAVLSERHPGLVTAMLAIMKAGGVFVPLDPGFPEQRLANMLELTECRWIITQAGWLEKLRGLEKGGPKREILVLDDFYANDRAVGWEGGFAEAAANKHCYIYFTSGSTGQPKAILGRQRSLSHFIAWEIDEFQVDRTCRVSQLTSPSFDPFLRDVLVPLCAGGTLCIPDDAEMLLDPVELPRWIEEKEITLIHIVPSLFSAVFKAMADESRFQRLRYILLAGEMLRGNDLKNFMTHYGSRIELVNLYGPSETTLAKFFCRIGREDMSRTIIPVGKAIRGAQALILDNDLHRCEKGAAGEIYIRTPYLTSGYYNNRELTKQVFIRNPFSDNPQDIIYKTGDIGRIWEDGKLELIGRIDQQVKIRGFRIELGEIENRLLNHREIREVVVTAVAESDNPGEEGERSLCAYFTADKALAVREIKGFLANELPEYMIPAYFVQMEKLPLTPTGKVDKKALPRPEARIGTGLEPEAPENETESKLAQIWQELLHLEKVGVNESFFNLGGHSLKATALVARIHKEFKIELPLREVFRNHTIKELAQKINETAESSYASIPPAEKAEYYPVSHAQKRMYLLNKLEPESTGYNTAQAVMIEGGLDRGRLEAVFVELLARHESLRTSFEMQDGEVVQRVHPSLSLPICFRKTKEGEITKVAEDFIRPFALNRAPLLRVMLLKTGPKKHVLIFDMHHIISDATSLAILAQEFAALYSGAKLPPLRIQYKDFAVWQQGLPQTAALKRQEEYWLNQFAGEIPAADLPTDYPRLARLDFAGDSCRFRIDRESTAKLKGLALQQGATMFSLLLAAYNIVLSRLTGQEDVIVGAPVAGRRHADLERIIGVFLNTAALRNYPLGNKTFLEFLSEVQENALQAFQNQDYQFEMLLDQLKLRRDAGRNPLFDTVFNYHNMDSGSAEFAVCPDGVRFTPYELKKDTTKFDLIFYFREAQGEVRINCRYRTSLYKKGSVEYLAGEYLRLLREIAQDPHMFLKDYRILSSADLKPQGHQVGQDAVFAEFKPEELNGTVVRRFEEQADRQGDRIAVKAGTAVVTYRELNAAADRIAAVLQRECGEEGQALDRAKTGALLFEQGPQMIAGILGVLKAGRIYVPLDPAYPEERLAYLLADSQACLLLTNNRNLPLAEKLAGIVRSKLHIINLDRINSSEQISQDDYPDGYPGKHHNGHMIYLYDNAGAKRAPEDAAYILYTSGSTGRPKGVVQSHRNILNFIRFYTNTLQINPCDRIALLTSYSHTVSVIDIFSALLNGAAVCLYDLKKEGSLGKLSEWLLEEKITVYHSVPSVYRYCLEAVPTGTIFGGMRRVVLGGEAVLPSDVELYRRHFPDGCVFVNLFGSSEVIIATACLLHKNTAVRGAAVPVGYPADGVRVKVLAENGREAGVYRVGELAYQSDYLALGYWNLPEKKAEAFSGGETPGQGRVYRSGDLGRILPDGSVEYLGRHDFQVKIRGYRVELQEIESCLMDYPPVTAAAAGTCGDRNGERFICAYYTAAAELSAAELREYLAQRLPDYMIPACFLQLAEMPLTPNGKIDRKALPVPEGNPAAQTAYEAPADDAEERMAALWQEVLGVKRIGVNDNFFELGGHSLKAAALVAGIHREFDAELALKEIFAHPTVKTLAQLVKGARESKYLSIPRVQEAEYYPVSSAQKRMYLLNMLESASTGYNITQALLIEGRLDREKLAGVFRKLLARHEILRTSFATIEGEVVQRVEDKADVQIDYRQAAEQEIPAIARRFVRPFALSKAPLMRVLLIEIEAEKHVLLYDMHHIISDGTSMIILAQEFAALYNGRELPAPALQYKDFAAWHNRFLQTGRLKKQEEYWLKTLAGEIPVLNVPADYPRPALQSFAGERHSFKADRTLTGKINTLAAQTGATLYMVLLSAYYILLARYAGQEDVIVGSPIAGRQHAELKNMLGMFVNTLALRNYPASDKTVLEFLNQVRENTLQAYENQGFQFEMLLDKLNLPRDLSRNPLFDTMFILQNMDRREAELRGVKTSPYTLTNKTAKFDLTLTAAETKEGIVFVLEYCTSLFAEETIRRMAVHYLNILQEMTAQPEKRLADINLLPEEEKKRILLGFNQTKTAYPRDKTIQELFEEQVKRTPDAAALVFQDRQLTYAELNAKANQLALVLRSKGLKPDRIAGIMVSRSPEMIIAILGVLKAGGAYLPLDPGYPAERISYMLEDSRAGILLTQSRLSGRVEFAGEILDLDDESICNGNGTDLAPLNKATDLAYVIYTSGSTGQPKGVMIEHRAVNNFITGITEKIEFLPGRAILALTTISFDIFVLETILPLTRGLKIVIAAEEDREKAGRLSRLIEKHGIEMLQATPAGMQMLLTHEAGAAAIQNIRHLLIGGEAFPAGLLATLQQLAQTRIYNMYGPTETTIWSTVRDLTQAKKVDIGKPISNTQVFILDRNDQTQPVGVWGELCLGGDGLARGYLNRPELTAEKFVENPLLPGERMYKTGDLARWLADGNIESGGRWDRQVKIRGFRIELGEIESRLLQVPELKEAAVAAGTDERGNQYLAAYLAGEGSLSAAGLREHLGRSLPGYMIPTYFIQLKQLPLTPNGKIDRKALPAPSGSIAAEAAYEAPANEIEERLAALWQEVLGIERIGRRDNFFELGGQSLKAAVLAARIHREFAAELALKEIFAHPTVKDLAQELGGARESEFFAIPRAQEANTYPLSFAQRRMYVLSRLEGENTGYNMPRAVLIEGELDRGRLEEAFRKLVQRHEAFRTSFVTAEGEAVQRVEAEGRIEIPFIEADPDRIKKLAAQFITPFDLSRAPLLRVLLIKIADRKHVLLYDTHHIISDGTSQNILIREFIALYHGEELPAPAIRYKDFAVWQNEFAQTKRMKKQEEYWLETFAGEIPALNLPTDYPRSAALGWEGAFLKFETGKELTRDLKKLALESGTTLFVILLAAYNVMLARLTGQEDVIVGAAAAGRRHADLEKVIGVFINTLALRNYPHKDKAFRQFLLEVRENSLKAFENQDYQFEMLLDKLNLSREPGRNPLFDTVLNFQNLIESAAAEEVNRGGLRFTPLELERNSTKFDLLFYFSETAGKIRITCNYRTGLYREPTIRYLVGEYLKLLAELAGEPDKPLQAYNLFSRQSIVKQGNRVRVAKR